jgi:hypothetical protein
MTALYGERSAQLDELFKALSKFHGDIKNVERTRQGEFGLYADLGNCWDTVRKAMQDNGLALAQPIVPYGQDGSVAVVSHLGHTSGQFLTSTIPLTPGLSLQAMAGEATYARRISMASLLGLAADWDDDGKQSKTNHEVYQHRYANETDKKWSEKAKKAIQDAIENEDDDRLTAIQTMIEEAVTNGKISADSKRMLAEFRAQVGEVTLAN